VTELPDVVAELNTFPSRFSIFRVSQSEAVIWFPLETRPKQSVNVTPVKYSKLVGSSPPSCASKIHSIEHSFNGAGLGCPGGAGGASVLEHRVVGVVHRDDVPADALVIRAETRDAVAHRDGEVRDLSLVDSLGSEGGTCHSYHAK
jgi:hypothetical protein